MVSIVKNRDNITATKKYKHSKFQITSAISHYKMFLHQNFYLTNQG